jgi:acetyl-CoA synthetase
VAQRLLLGKGRVLVTTESLYRRKVAPVRDRLTDLRHVLVVRESAEPVPEGTVDLAELMAASSDDYEIGPTDPEDLALLHFTSGTTGRPKGAMHVHGAVLAHYVTAGFSLDLRPDDVFWCTADPGWITGTSYGVIAPLTRATTVVVDEAEYDARRWYRVLEEQRVTVWYTAPTAIRMLMRAGTELPRAHDLSALRHVCSVGEPLNPEGVLWGVEALGQPVHDTWWQTETGAIMDEPARYLGQFTDGWYRTGDVVRRDADGYFWFLGRADDVIKSAGHLIGPFEVESCLMEHPAVVEAGVIGKPDPVAGEVVKAFVSLRPGYSPTEDLRLDLLGFARRRLGGMAPKEIDFDQNLPHTRSGKVMRRLLKARELGLPEGDLSTVEQRS